MNNGRRFWLGTVILLLGAIWGPAAGHSPLLPRPQEIRYTGSTARVPNLTVWLTGQGDAEDLFAASQLTNGLAKRARVPIALRRGTTSAPRSIREPVILLTRTGQGGAVPADKETTGPESREAYTVQLTPAGGEVRAKSSAGLFYGVQTVLQLVEGEGRAAVLPTVEIRDWPELAYRGFMMDFSHGQLLRVAEVERQLDLLARFKANQYYFYSEASIELEGYELVNLDGRFTRAELKHIIDYARQRHIDVVPCLELYGHLHDLFRVEKFAELGLPRYGDEFDPRNPRVIGVLDDLVDQYAKLFSSAWVHVGFDEPWSLGKIGVTPGKDPFQTFAEVLRHVAERAQQRGKRLMFWADIMNGASTLSNHPELIQQLPAGTIAVPWVYDAYTNYSPYIEPLAQANLPTVVAPAVWNWNEIFPDYHRSFVNINGLTAAGRKFKTLGILTTGWTDSAQTLYRPSLPGLALGAAAGWQSGPVDTNSFFGDYCAIVYPPAVAEKVAPALEELSTVQERFQRALQSTTQHAFWREPLDPAYLARMEKREEDLRQARLLAGTALERILKAQNLAPDEPTLRSLVVSARRFDYLAMRNLYPIEWARYFKELKGNPDQKLVTLYVGIQMNAQDHGMLADLVDTVTGLGESYRAAWLEEATPYRLGTAMARWDAEAQYWLGTWRNVTELLRNRGKDEPFPGLEVIRPKR